MHRLLTIFWLPPFDITLSLQEVMLDLEHGRD